MKKTLIVLLILTLILGNAGTVTALSPPGDTAGLPCGEAVKALSDAGIINSYPDGTYRPDKAVTRAEASKLIVTALGYDDSELTLTGKFSDARGNWAEKYIAQCAQLGVNNGYRDATFKPASPVTYDEFLTMLVRALGYTDLDGAWPANVIEKAKETGILGAVSTGKGKVTRGDAAILLYQTWTKPIGTTTNGLWTANAGNDTMQNRIGLGDFVNVMKTRIDGEEAFDFMSYVYLGWRTTGGPWQNYVIRDYLAEQLKAAGFTYSDTDKSKSSDKDSVWIQHDDSSDLVWAPQYASLTVTSKGDRKLIDRFNAESSSFDPTSDIYMDYYGDQYGVKNIDDMYKWITQKKADGTRTNVANGLEADLNSRAHLAGNSCFTDAPGTAVDQAKGAEGEVVYIGEVKNVTEGGVTVLYGSETGLEGNAALAGKVLLSDSDFYDSDTYSGIDTFHLAKQVGAIAIISDCGLSGYNNPTVNGKQLYTDSARYYFGSEAPDSLAAMKEGKPIVLWNLSLDQKAAMMELLKQGKAAGTPVTVKSVAIGSIYSMAYKDAGEGQLTAIAEIKGTTKADERVIFMAHVQEPGACDNASGVGVQLELALKLKQMIDDGTLERPERTITFMWGDEMTCSDLWMNAHPDEKANVVCTIDLDMVGEDPAKTGGPMRIEKTPDPSAFYNYTLDVLPGEDPYSDPEAFVRLPDSHTLWGAGEPPEISALYLNDLYMAAAQNVVRSVDRGFKVAVCPFEGGSDHEVFLNAGIPAVLTWHFTDYIYHTSSDTLEKASAREMKDVGITSLAAGYMAADAGEYQTGEMMRIVYNAAVQRFKAEMKNTVNHYAWTTANKKNAEDELALELEILDAWGEWYVEALESCEKYFLKDGGSEAYQAKEAAYIEKISQMLTDAKALARDTFEGKAEAAS